MERTLSVRIDDSLDHDLEREARRLRTSKGEVVRDALRARLKAPGRSAYDALKPLAGLISGPSDLSTNKARLSTLGRPRRRR
jgi:Arc/MetJ-type ribon-helix-helix transcriptional regulator